MVPINLTIVVARPGARGDFVAGWLGTLPNFVDNQWRIDIPTGRSVGLMSCFREIDSLNYGPDTLNRLLGFRNFSLGQSKWNFAMSCHGHGIEEKIILTPEIKFLQILTDTADRSVVNWEFIAKTYFSKERFESSLHENKIYNVDKIETNCPIDFIKQRARDVRDVGDYNLKLDCARVQYKELFQPGGSRYLTDVLEIQVDPEYHQYWDSQLSIASSKHTYDIFGKQWTINDYWK